MKSLGLFIYQKNKDLHCLSAFEAIKQFMKKDRCSGLKRYVNWDISYDSQLDPAEFLTQITAHSYYLYNPNKEGIFINELPGYSTSKQRVLVAVHNTLLPESENVKRSINDRYGVAIKSLFKRVVWECQIEGTDYDDAVSYVTDHLLGTHSIENGILVNPIYEKAVVLDPAVVYSSGEPCPSVS